VLGPIRFERVPSGYVTVTEGPNGRNAPLLDAQRRAAVTRKKTFVQWPVFARIDPLRIAAANQYGHQTGNAWACISAIRRSACRERRVTLATGVASCRTHIVILPDIRGFARPKLASF
jgi:hypothetical protein